MAEMAEKHERADTVDLIAGRLCLDYVNTVDWRDGERVDDQGELLRTYGDLVAWARHADIVRENEAANLLAAALRRPNDAAAVLRDAILLREALYHLFAAAMQGHAADTGDLDTFNAALARTLAQARITPTALPALDDGAGGAGGFAWSWSRDANELDQMLRPIVRSAADLLTSAELGRVRVCADEHCRWFFLDTSRNHSRRWCSMEDCGNRAKARRHYQRRRAGMAPR